MSIINFYYKFVACREKSFVSLEYASTVNLNFLAKVDIKLLLLSVFYKY